MSSSSYSFSFLTPRTGSSKPDDTVESAPKKTESRGKAPPLALSDAEARTILQPEDHKVFFDALDTPPEPTEALREAFEHYRDTVDSR